ncbi:hypothetical protein PGT21_007764 [Puccinia graminis f. sp. tritici]|uniref:Uncharacterized protein n=1 Tax=Puccinia graminis f. sp. tritici TaxID=56615 RepID=A0A5B0P0Y2_PUCGR|nr:hypothetical protein PGT21_007764 [Puccinia graminis f. sp. tritici]KAA1093679.1 hypothetical protein PGTUg99_019528 [Puccinia graminis f. sp. tritici]
MLSSSSSSTQPPTEYIEQLTNQLLNKQQNNNNNNNNNNIILHSDPHHLSYLTTQFNTLLELNQASEPKQPSSIKAYQPTEWMIGVIQQKTQQNPNPLLSTLGSYTTWTIQRPKILTNLLLSPFQQQQQQQQPKNWTTEQQLKYLYSTFTKLNSLQLTPASSPSNSISSTPTTDIEPMQLLEGLIELPGQSTVPLCSFKSLWSIYIDRLDPRIFSGWARLSQNLRRLEINRSGILDFEDFLIDTILLDSHQNHHHLESAQQDLNSDQSNRQDPKPSQQEERSEPETQQTEDVQEAERITEREAEEKPTEQQAGKQRDGEEHQTPQSLPSNFPAFAWCFLQHLSLAHNSLTFLSTRALLALKSLVSLDLSSNLLIAVPTGLGHLPRLKSLNISNNMIDSLLGIYLSLGSVTSLNLSRNRLSSLCGLERLTTLERLDVRQNQIQDIGELSRLATLPGLTSLWASMNPFTIVHQQQQEWRVRIFEYFAREDREIDRKAPGLVALQLENQGPSYLETKAIRGPVRRRSPTLERPILVDQKPLIVRRTPDHRHSSRSTSSLYSPRARSSEQEEEEGCPSPRLSLPDPAHHHPPSITPSTSSSLSPSTTKVLPKKKPTSRKKPARIVDFQSSSPTPDLPSRLTVDRLSPSRTCSNPCLPVPSSSSSSSTSSPHHPTHSSGPKSAIPSSSTTLPIPASTLLSPHGSSFASSSPSSSSVTTTNLKDSGKGEKNGHHDNRFRKRIEMLKHELGEDRWLRVLGESEFGSLPPTPSNSHSHSSTHHS